MRIRGDHADGAQMTWSVECAHCGCKRELYGHVSTPSRSLVLNGAVVYGQQANGWRRAHIRSVARQSPGPPPVGLYLKANDGLHERHTGYVHVAKQQGPEFDFKLGRRSLQQIGLIGPLWVGELHAIGPNGRTTPRVRPQVNSQMLRDFKTAPELPRHIMVDRAPQFIPRKKKDQYDHHQNERYGSHEEMPENRVRRQQFFHALTGR